MAEALTQNQAQQGVEDIDSTKDGLQATGPRHQTEQNYIPLNHGAGLKTNTGPQRAVVQIPCVPEDTDKS